MWSGLIRRSSGVSFIDDQARLLFYRHLRAARCASGSIKHIVAWLSRAPDSVDEDTLMWLAAYAYFLHQRIRLGTWLDIDGYERTDQPPHADKPEYCMMAGNYVVTWRKDMGCRHYARACRLFSPCCALFYTCRHCHDVDNEASHTLERRSVPLTMCVRCGTIQEPGKNCLSQRCSGRAMARYFCNTCRFYDDDPDKEILHCADCGVCRMGSPSDTFHCPTCARCVWIRQHEFLKHTC